LSRTQKLSQGPRLEHGKSPGVSRLTYDLLSNAGVLAATTSDIRARRLATLESLADMEALPVDEDAARVWARLRIHLAETGRRVRINDLWIAAIAASRTLPIITQDDDFDPLDGIAGLVVIRV
jgi:predicted nucleic acid-binding protein